IGVVCRADAGDGRPHPQLPRGEARRRPLRHGQDHQQPSAGRREGGELRRPQGVGNQRARCHQGAPSQVRIDFVILPSPVACKSGLSVPWFALLRTIDELGLDSSIVSGFLDELEQLLKGVAMMKELTLRTRDYLVSFGECMSTRIFAAYLNKLGKKARQYDAFDLGFITTDDFTNADILEATYPAVAKRLHGDWIDDPAIPVVTGFLGKGWKSCAVTTLGRGGSDLTATTIGKALGLREIQVWKDVDGVLTCDPNIYANAVPVPYLTFDEAAELAYFGAQVLHPQSMRPAREGGIPVRVKNSYNRHAPGTVITKTRDMRKSILTSIVLKSNITMLDIVSTRMLGQYGFLAKVNNNSLVALFPYSYTLSFIVRRF
uniref:Aspartokinase n=1 Tax=Aegilops tauschii subsp. strangulata TaxID=200361 RepID=A0A453MHR2_AEGTS